MGRRNRYTLVSDRPLHHPAASNLPVRALLALLTSREEDRASLTEQLSRSGSCSASSSSHIDPADDLADVVYTAVESRTPSSLSHPTATSSQPYPEPLGPADPTDDQLRPMLGR